MPDSQNPASALEIFLRPAPVYRYSGASSDRNGILFFVLLSVYSNSPAAPVESEYDVLLVLSMARVTAPKEEGMPCVAYPVNAFAAKVDTHVRIVLGILNRTQSIHLCLTS